ncbi:MAG: YesL family protein [Chloroflexota bacterium]
MSVAMSVIRWGVRNWYDEMVMFTGVGLVSFVFQLPFGFATYIFLAMPPDLFPILIPFVMAFLPSPAVVGMYGIGRELARGEGVSWGLFWSLMRRYWRRSLLVYLVSSVSTLILFLAMRFYMSSENDILRLLGFLWLYVLLVWLVMQLYIVPLMLEQERWNLWRLYRNAFVVVAVKPVLSLILLVLTLILLVVGIFTVIGLPIVVMPIIAVLGSHALQFAVYGPPQKRE